MGGPQEHAGCAVEKCRLPDSKLGAAGPRGLCWLREGHFVQLLAPQTPGSVPRDGPAGSAIPVNPGGKQRGEEDRGFCLFS